MSQEHSTTELPPPGATPPLAYANVADSPWPMIVRCLSTFGFALGACTIVRMAIDAAGAFGIIDAPSLLAGQARHAGWAVWVLFFLIVTTLLHVILVTGSLLAMRLRPQALTYLHTYAVGSASFVALSVAANWAYFLSTGEWAEARAYFLTIFLVNGINHAAFPLATLVLLKSRGFAAVFEGFPSGGRMECGG